MGSVGKLAAWMVSAVAMAAAGCDVGREPLGEMAPERQATAGLEDLLRTASTYHLPMFEGEGRLPAMGDTHCILRRSRAVEVEGVAMVMTAVFAAPDKACLKPGALELNLWRAETSPDDNGERLAHGEGSDQQFGFGHYLGPMRFIGDVGFPREPNAVDVAARVKFVDDRLKALVATPPFPARRLPPWREDALAPELAPELKFTPLVDRQTYEAVRAGPGMVMCWKVEETELRCVTEAPRRRPSDLALFSLRGFNDFRSQWEAQAVNRLLTGPVSADGQAPR